MGPCRNFPASAKRFVVLPLCAGRVLVRPGPPRCPRMAAVIKMAEKKGCAQR
jgi:hypothetical protein